MIPIISRIPPIQGLVQAIEPIRRGWQVGNLIARNVLWNETGDGVADKHVGVLDIPPQVIPDILLRATGLGHQVTANLDVRSVDDGAIGADILDEWNKARHLRVVDLILG